MRTRSLALCVLKHLEFAWGYVQLTVESGQVNDLYMGNAMWFIYVTMTTVGCDEAPISHLRVVLVEINEIFILDEYE